MTIDTFIINLDDAHQRYRETKSALLQASGFSEQHIFRFDAKRCDRSAPDITLFCRTFCPDKTLGCALSHRAVADFALTNSHYISFPILILEDDTYPTEPASLAESIIQLKTQYKDRDWDIILLDTAGLYSSEGQKAGFLSGSTAAYLLSKEGALKLRDAVIPWHADILRNSSHFRVYQGPRLFHTRDAQSTGMIIGSRDIAWYAQQPLFNYSKGLKDRNILGGHVGVCAILVLVCAWFCLPVKSSSTLVALFKIAIVQISCILVGFLTAFVMYVGNDSNYARTSTSTACISIVGALFSVVLATKMLWRSQSDCDCALAVVVLLFSYWVMSTHAFWQDEATSRRQKCARD